MIMRKILLTFAVAACSLGVRGADGWTLEQCLGYAREHNIQVRLAEVERQKAAEDIRQAQAALLPTLNANTNQSVGYRPWTSDGQASVANGMVANKIKKGYYNGSYGINASWTVWNGGQNTNTVRLNRLAEKQAGLAAEESLLGVEEQIMKLYTQILYLKEAVRVDEQSLEASRTNEARGREMTEAGLLSKADLAQLTAQTAQDGYAVVEAQTTVANYLLQLRQLLELTADDGFDIAPAQTTEALATEAALPMAEVYAAASARRPEIAAAQSAIESAELQVKIARAGYLPIISLTGGLGTSTSSMSDRQWGTQMKTNFDASAGLTLSVPIFDGRKTKTQVSRAHLAQTTASLDLQDRQQKLRATVENYWLDTTSQQQRYIAARSATRSMQESYDLAAEQFRLGLKNITELLQAKTNLLAAQQKELEAKYMAVLNNGMLKWYAGTK